MKNASELFELLDRKEPLIEELRPYVFDGSFGRKLHHPLIIELFFDESRAALINAHYRAKKADLDKALAESNWPTFVFLHERPYRLHALLKALSEDPDNDDMPDLVAHAWADSENIWQHKKDWIGIWKSLKDPHLTMTEEERAALAAMPYALTVYRGIKNKSNTPRGLSWTLDQRRAEWFSRRWASKRDKPVLLTADVSKKDVLAYFTGRNESEIVVLPKSLKNVRQMERD